MDRRHLIKAMAALAMPTGVAAAAGDADPTRTVGEDLAELERRLLSIQPPWDPSDSGYRLGERLAESYQTADDDEPVEQLTRRLLRSDPDSRHAQLPVDLGEFMEWRLVSAGLPPGVPDNDPFRWPPNMKVERVSTAKIAVDVAQIRQQGARIMFLAGLDSLAHDLIRHLQDTRIDASLLSPEEASRVATERTASWLTSRYGDSPTVVMSQLRQCGRETIRQLSGVLGDDGELSAASRPAGWVVRGPVKVHIRREAYLLECFAYLETAR